MMLFFMKIMKITMFFNGQTAATKKIEMLVIFQLFIAKKVLQANY